MDESFLIKFALLSILIGVIIMFLANKIIELKITKIGDINEKDNFIRVAGQVISVVKKGDVSFIKLKDSSSTIDVVIFKNSLQNETLPKTGSFVEINGKLQKYKGGLEIIATKIK